MSKITIEVSGMSCGHCKMAVESELKDLDGVLSANVNLDAATVEVEYDDSKLNLDDLKAAIEEAGYEPK